MIGKSIFHLGTNPDGPDIEPTTVSTGDLALAAHIFEQDAGPEALTALLQASCGVNNVSDVPEGMSFIVHTALVTQNHKATGRIVAERKAANTLANIAKKAFARRATK